MSDLEEAKLEVLRLDIRMDRIKNKIFKNILQISGKKFEVREARLR